MSEKRTCDYSTGYGLPHIERCGLPAVGQWHTEDDEWFCAKHMAMSACERCGDLIDDPEEDILCRECEDYNAGRLVL